MSEKFNPLSDANINRFTDRATHINTHHSVKYVVEAYLSLGCGQLSQYRPVQETSHNTGQYRPLHTIQASTGHPSCQSLTSSLVASSISHTGPF